MYKTQASGLSFVVLYGDEEEDCRMHEYDESVGSIIRNKKSRFLQPNSQRLIKTCLVDVFRLEYF